MKARPSCTLPMTNGSSCRLAETLTTTHLPKTIHNITRTTLRFKTRKAGRRAFSRGKTTGRHPTSQFCLLLLSPFLPFFFFLCLCL